MNQYLAVDVGGTNIKYALMNEDGSIVEKGEYPTPLEDGLDGFLDSLQEVYHHYDGKVKALVMSAPGRIDSSTGYFYTSGALRYIDHTDLTAKMKGRIPVPFAVENDAKSAALAELWMGSMKGVQNGVVMTVGTGIGGSVIIDGKLYRGSSFAAGEFSGIPVRWDHTVYQLNEMWAIENSVGRLVSDYAGRIGADAKKLNGRILFEAAEKGDQNALDAIDAWCGTLAAGIMGIQFVLDVEKVAIGGGISRQPLLIQSLRRALHTYYDAVVGMMPASIPEVVPCTFGNDANLIGALYHYLFELKKERD